MRSGVSYRAYELGPQREATFCVSTRSTEVTIVLEGELSIDFGARRQDATVRPDAAIVIARGTPHRCRSTEKTRFVVFDLANVPIEAPGIVELPRDRLKAPLVDLTATVWLADRAVPLERLVRAPEHVLGALQRASVITPEQVHHTRRMYDVKRYLECHYAEPIRIERIASTFRLDPHYLIRSFKQNFGVTPHAYIQFLRTEHFVWEALSNAADRRGRSHTDTACEAGFGDYATFSRRMHAQFGKPPSRLIESDEPAL